MKTLLLIMFPCVLLAQSPDSTKITLMLPKQEMEMGKTIFIMGTIGAITSAFLIEQHKKVPEFYPHIFLGVAVFGTTIHVKGAIRLHKMRKRPKRRR